LNSPALIPNGEDVRTISVPTILTTYKWPENSDRYRLLSSFYSTLKARLNQLQSSSYVHPKWRDVSLSAPFKGWPRSSIVLDDASAALTPPAYPAAAERPAPGNG
jgi:hypothetical protein